MIIERTSTPWVAIAALFRKCVKVPPYKVMFTFERCARTLKVGCVVLCYLYNELQYIHYYKLSQICCYTDVIKQILAVDYGFYKSN